MALDQSALLDLLEALKAADVSDRVRTTTRTLYQEEHRGPGGSSPSS